MNPKDMQRRDFLQTTAAAGAAAVSIAGPTVIGAQASTANAKPALLGGDPVRTESFPSWPIYEDNDEKAWLDVLHARQWCRTAGPRAAQFGDAFAKMWGAKEGLAVNSGTSSLLTSLNALDIGPGDEVLVGPYTFIATVNVILLQHALPIFVDTDRETSQMDMTKVEEKITPDTRCIIPIHLGGNVADLGTLLPIARKHNIPVVEDACQSHLAEWEGKKAGTFGATGCFSFQVTKNLSGGDGGMIITNDSDIMDRCYAFHTNSRPRAGGNFSFGAVGVGANMRMTEFVAALLMEQMTRLETQTSVRDKNAAYLNELLSEIPGITPAKMYDGCTRNAYHLFMSRYDPEAFSGLPRSKFLEALRKEGIPCSQGYSPLNEQAFIKNQLNTRGYKKIYSEKRLKQYFEENHCPENNKLCEEAFWFFQTMLLDTRTGMEQIADAIRKIQAHADELKKA